MGLNENIDNFGSLWEKTKTELNKNNNITVFKNFISELLIIVNL
jgi:hypothetical protein